MSTRIARPSSAMRKAPKQARSRATVEIILEAGARILSDEGWAGFTTNKVADLAGVSIGSLYQYFPDKLSLVDAIRRRHLDDCLTVMKSVSDATPYAFASKLVRAMISAHSGFPGLHRVLLDEAPSSDDYRDPHSDFEVEYLAHYAAAVAAFRGRPPCPEDLTAARIISDAMDGVIHNAARRGAIGDPSLQAELIRLIGLYLSDADQNDGVHLPTARRAS